MSEGYGMLDPETVRALQNPGVESWDLMATAICKVCGETVTRIMAPLHIEDHAQRGDLPVTAGAPPPCQTGSDGASRPERGQP